jgi:3',5'-cyclic AMP phosphodiesterase CpdA
VLTIYFAHLSDVHLGPLPAGATFSHFALKRVIGSISWNRGRKKIFRPEVAKALRQDIIATNPLHVAFTGDLVNIAAWSEFTQGANWLKEFGADEFISFTPGNHDEYVPVPWEHGLGKFAPYMSHDKRDETGFPFIRLRRNIAFIGVNGACKQGLFSAGGTVGEVQRTRLASALNSLRKQGFYRAVMIHHPPAPGLAHVARSLSDAAEMKSILETEGAELIMHGHNHKRSLNFLDSKDGQIPIIGVPSASMATGNHHDPAAWNKYEVSRSKGQWHTEVSIRQWNGKAMQDGDKFSLPPRT